MPTLHANGIDIYYERSGSGPAAALPQRFRRDAGDERACSSTSSPTRFDVVAHDQRGLGRTVDPARPVLDGRVRRRRGRPARRGGLGHGAASSASASVAWSRRSSRSRSRSGRAAGARLHVARWAGAVVPAARARRLADAERAAWHPSARHPLHAGVARRAPRRPGARRDDGRARRGPKSAEQRRGETRAARRASATTSATASARSRARRWSRAAATTASRRWPTARRSRRGCRGEFRRYEGGHAFFVQDPRGAPRDPRLPRRAALERRGVDELHRGVDTHELTRGAEVIDAGKCAQLPRRERGGKRLAGTGEVAVPDEHERRNCDAPGGIFDGEWLSGRRTATPPSRADRSRRSPRVGRTSGP